MSQRTRQKGQRRNRRNHHGAPRPQGEVTTVAAPASGTVPSEQTGQPAASATAGTSTSQQRRRPASHQGGQRRRYPRPTEKKRQRWFYDVRQYALLTDADDKILLLQLPAEYDAGTANTWTLPGGKLEPADEPLAGLQREITEETALTLTAPPQAATVARWSTRNSKKLAIFYRASVSGSMPAATLSAEHQRAVWVKASELPGFPFHRPEMLGILQGLLGLKPEKNQDPEK